MKFVLFKNNSLILFNLSLILLLRIIYLIIKKHDFIKYAFLVYNTGYLKIFLYF